MTPKTVEETTEGGLPIRDLFAFAGVRAIIGDPYGKLMQDEVADRIQKLCNVLRETVGIMDAFRMIEGLPGMSQAEKMMARVNYRTIKEMLETAMPEYDAVCKAIHEANTQSTDA